MLCYAHWVYWMVVQLSNELTPSIIGGGVGFITGLISSVKYLRTASVRSYLLGLARSLYFYTPASALGCGISFSMYAYFSNLFPDASGLEMNVISSRDRVFEDLTPFIATSIPPPLLSFNRIGAATGMLWGLIATPYAHALIDSKPLLLHSLKGYRYSIPTTIAIGALLYPRLFYELMLTKPRGKICRVDGLMLSLADQQHLKEVSLLNELKTQQQQQNKL